MQIRVYEYGCGRGQVEGLDLAIDQMRRRTEFWNRMVEIDIDVRARMDALLFAGKDETELRDLRETPKKLLRRGINGRSDEDGTKKDQEQIKAVRAAIRARLAEVKRIRKDNAAKHPAELRELDDNRKVRIAEAQAKA